LIPYNSCVFVYNQTYVRWENHHNQAQIEKSKSWIPCNKTAIKTYGVIAICLVTAGLYHFGALHALKNAVFRIHPQDPKPPLPPTKPNGTPPRQDPVPLSNPSQFFWKLATASEIFAAVMMKAPSWIRRARLQASTQAPDENIKYFHENNPLPTNEQLLQCETQDQLLPILAPGLVGPRDGTYAVRFAMPLKPRPFGWFFRLLNLGDVMLSQRAKEVLSLPNVFSSIPPHDDFSTSPPLRTYAINFAKFPPPKQPAQSSKPPITAPQNSSFSKTAWKTAKIASGCLISGALFYLYAKHSSLPLVSRLAAMQFPWKFLAIGGFFAQAVPAVSALHLRARMVRKPSPSANKKFIREYDPLPTIEEIEAFRDPNRCDPSLELGLNHHPDKNTYSIGFLMPEIPRTCGWFWRLLGTSSTIPSPRAKDVLRLESAFKAAFYGGEAISDFSTSPPTLSLILPESFSKAPNGKFILKDDPLPTIEEIEAYQNPENCSYSLWKGLNLNDDRRSYSIKFLIPPKRLGHVLQLESAFKVKVATTTPDSIPVQHRNLSQKIIHLLGFMSTCKLLSHLNDIPDEDALTTTIHPLIGDMQGTINLYRELYGVERVEWADAQNLKISDLLSAKGATPAQQIKDLQDFKASFSEQGIYDYTTSPPTLTFRLPVQPPPQQVFEITSSN
jgi:hypothetical protein